MVCVATARRKRRRRKREAETNVLIEITAFVADFTYINDNMYDNTAGARTLTPTSRCIDDGASLQLQ